MRFTGLLGVAGAAFVAIAAQVPSPSLPLAVGGDPDVRVVWGRIVSSPGDDWINDLVPLTDGNILSVGFVDRADSAFGGDWKALAVELGDDGTVIADRRYGAGGGMDAVWSVAQTPDGNRIFAGFTTRVGPAGINGYVLVTRPDGTIVKENGFGHAGYDRFTDLAAAPDGYVFVGHSQLPGPDALRRTYIVKTDSAGLPRWERIYGGSETWSALYIAPAGDGGFVIAGGTDGGGDSDMFVQKIDAEGRQLWRKRIGTPDWDEINHGLLVRPDGGIVLVGYTHARGAESNDLVAATLAADGTVERLERFGGTSDDRAILAKADSAGVVWIVGQTASAGAGGSDLLLTGYDPSRGFTGAALTLGGPADDNGTAVLPIADGLLVAGYSRNLGSPSQDAFVARLDRPPSGRHPAFARTVVRSAR